MRKRHPLFDPEICRVCRAKGVIIDSRRVALGYRRRRHTCRTCGRRWTSYESLVHPGQALKFISGRYLDSGSTWNGHERS